MKGDVIDDAALVMDRRDSVATALEDLETGRTLSDGKRDVTLSDEVPFGHKFALEPIDRGDDIFKYGAVIGRATDDVPPGSWVHTHNCESTRGRGDQQEGKR
ncbi:UxaA family hydrolase [Haladaptatus sp. DYF46]|uniref:UxaA family hydrolase n=1 Tax=Haladaptatus sp. DYF46 TaxID=2886041 RepID=UPI001E5EBD8E|nr:UxaA family hydrolase [Haladaptatus sp. DYF46]